MRSGMFDTYCYWSYVACLPNGMMHEREGRQKFEMLNMWPLLQLWRL